MQTSTQKQVILWSYMETLNQEQTIPSPDTIPTGISMHEETNLYPILRTIFIVILIIIVICIAIFLIYINGKSIYDHGI